ncbi:MAG: hypothetical protein FOGNACKC_03489 [Anaerolineae bacterium]|nr:hypothetical protein [Anaerolineae bacterium]
MAFNATNRRYPLRRMTPADFGRKIKGGPADDFALQRVNRKLTKEGQLSRLAVVATAGRVVEHRAAFGLIPGHVATGAAWGGKIACGQQAAVIRANEQGAIRPVPDKGPIVPAFLNHHIGQAQSQSAIGARPHLQPDIGLLGQPGVAGIDHNQVRPSFEGGHGSGSVSEPGQVWVVPPKQDTAGIFKIGHIVAGNTTTKGISRGQIPAPTAQLHRGAKIGAAKGVLQSFYPHG